MSNNSSEQLPARFKKPSIFSFAIYLLVATAIVLSFQGAGFDASFDLKRTLNSMWIFLSEMFPPNLGRAKQFAEALWVTLQMAIAGTVIGVLVSFPLCWLAAKNFAPNKLLYTLSRGLISLFRTIPDLIWALFFVITVGLGPLAGTLALVIDTIGFCGRFFAEAVEEAEPQPIQGLQALGANKISTIFCGVLPNVLPSFTNTSLFSLEKAVRSSVVLGLVGAGGIGIELKVSMDTFRYDEAATIIIAIFLMVLVVERLSAWIRGRLL